MMDPEAIREFFWPRASVPVLPDHQHAPPQLGTFQGPALRHGLAMVERVQMRNFLLTHEYADVYADMEQVLRIKFGKVHKGTKPVRYKVEKVHRIETK